MREKKGGDRKVGGTRGANGGWGGVGTRTRLYWRILSFVVSSPDPLTLYILLKGRGESRDASYRHWMHVCASVCVVGNADSMYQSKYEYLSTDIWVHATELYLPLRCDFSHHSSSLPMCLHPLPAESYGGGTMVSQTFPLSCRECSFVSCIPFPIHLFLSLPSWTEKKSYSLYGGGVWVCLLKTSEWNQSPLNTTSPSSPFLPVLLG